ncbi:MAG TPA: ATP-binding protein [Anaerolineae bacterium]|nr:ATP-binding protein [Anaerolineae bacterium]
MHTTSLLQDALHTITDFLALPVEGVGWTQQNGVVRLMEAVGQYLTVPEVQRTLEACLSALPPGDYCVRPAHQLGLAGNRTIVLLPDTTFARAGMLPFTIGLLLVFPSEITLTTEQLASLRAIAHLTTQALYGQQALQEAQRRQGRLAAAAAVGRDAAMLLDPDTLLRRVTQLIQQQFGFDHVGIFLMDETGEYLALQAANSMYGQQLVAQQYRLKVGEQGLVGEVAATGVAQVAVDVGPDACGGGGCLPHIRSEMALPFCYGDQIIGVLDVQSAAADAFTASDGSVLQMMADQVANLFANARLHAEVRQRLRDTRLLRDIMLQASALNQPEVLQRALPLLQATLPFPYQAFFEIRDGRLQATPGSRWPQLTYSLDIAPLSAIWHTGDVWRASSAAQLQWLGASDAASPITGLVALPLRNHTQTLALLAVATDDPRQIHPREQSFIEAVAAQLSVLLQNAQHYEAMVQGQELLRHLIAVGEALLAVQDLPLLLTHLSQAILERIRGTVEIALDIADEGLQWVAQMASPDLPAPVYLADFITLAHLDAHTHHTRVSDMGDAADRMYLKSVHPRMMLAVEEFKTRHLLIQPLQTTESVLGYLVVTLETADNSLPERIAWIQAVANQAALTLNNARLIMQLKQQTERLSHAYEEAKHLNDIRAQMIQNVSHELRTPLGIIIGYADMLREEMLGPLDESQQEIVQTILARAQDLNRMVQNLTSLQGRIQITALTPIALVELLRQVIQEFQGFAAEQRVQFYIEAKPDVPLIPGDLELLHLAFAHLVENAIKFSPDGGAVLVRIWEDAQWVLVSIADHGIGIPQEHLHHIFDRFYQVDGSTTRHFGGMGIGLALVWDILEAHRGYVQVQSAVGQGSTFLAALPCATEG